MKDHERSDAGFQIIRSVKVLKAQYEAARKELRFIDQTRKDILANRHVVKSAQGKLDHSLFTRHQTRKTNP